MSLFEATKMQRRWDIYVIPGGNELFRMAVRGTLLMVLTFGLYRFWFVSDLRRFFWSRTILDSSPLEYSGRGLELFIGFLIAVAILLPLSLAFFGLSLVSINVAVAGNIAYFAIMWFLGQYARYRARRYRLNRTIWRGIRLHLAGSAWKYAFMAMGWALLAVLTLGIIWPWASASLERYKVNNTWYGNLQLHSTAQWSDIFKPYAVIWVFIVAPLIILVLASMRISYVGSFGSSSFNDYMAIILGISALVPFVGILLYPWYKAVIMRTYFSRITAGTASLVAAFSTGMFYRIWFKTIGVMIAVSIVLGIVGGIGYFILAAILPKEVLLSPYSSIIVGIISYVVWIAVNYVITITVYHFGIWYHAGDSMTIINPEVIEEVRAGTSPLAGGVNEGFADALDVGGGFEIGL